MKTFAMRTSRLLLRRRHRPTIVIPPAERITCRHGLTRCDHCRPLYQTGMAARSALMTPTRLMPTVRTQPAPRPDPVPHPTGPGGPR